jgi:hypothetical protein
MIHGHGELPDDSPPVVVTVGAEVAEVAEVEVVEVEVVEVEEERQVEAEVAEVEAEPAEAEAEQLEVALEVEPWPSSLARSSRPPEAPAQEVAFP